MAFFIIVGTLAAFGLFSAFWCLFGWLLPKTGGILLCPEGTDAAALARRYLWLRGLGLISCPLVVADGALTEVERTWLFSHGIEVCARDALASRLGIGEKNTDGTGTGDPSGRDQRRGVSEL